MRRSWAERVGKMSRHKNYMCAREDGVYGIWVYHMCRYHGHTWLEHSTVYIINVWYQNHCIVEVGGKSGDGHVVISSLVSCISCISCVKLRTSLFTLDLSVSSGPVRSSNSGAVLPPRQHPSPLGFVDAS